MKIKLIFSALIILMSFCVNAQVFNFSTDKNKWSFYGEGIGTYSTTEGFNQSKGSLHLNTDLGEVKTTFYKWSGLAPGNYKVSFYIKSNNILKTKDQTSFWHFYDSGNGTQDVFRDLYGRYDWRKVEYNINVQKGDLTIWFRLVSPGKVWIDDFSLVKTSTSSKDINLKVAAPISFKNTVSKNESKTPKVNKVATLYNFDKDEYGHPFARRGNRGEFIAQEFYDFKINALTIKNWSEFDRLEMDVFNPNEGYVEFFTTLADESGTDYWSQLNHKQSLAPGWNKLSFSLTQYLGERGSHRHLRSLDLAKLKKFYIVIDPDKKHNYAKKRFLIDNLNLSSNVSPIVPKDVYFFNFTSVKSPEISNYKKITAQDEFYPGAEFGFVDPKFWRVEDSVYASELERYTIGILKGTFRIKLPNGSYKLRLNIDKLGYWDVPFWSDRMIYANGAPLYKAVRSSAQDFLKDVLRFESIIPKVGDSPYLLYLNNLFEVIEKDVVVRDGYLDLTFEGDASAISLNHLLIASNKNFSQAQKFAGEIKARNELEFKWMTRAIDVQNSKVEATAVTLVDTQLKLSPAALAPPTGEIIKWNAGRSEFISQMIQIKSQDVHDSISWTIKDLKKGNDTIPAQSLTVSKLTYQFTSPDLNHESYLVAGKYLTPTSGNKASLTPKQNEYFSLSMKTNEKQAPGLYKGEISFKVGNRSYKLPIELLVSNYSLSKAIDFPVGFFGLDPLPYSYFPNAGYAKIRHEYRMLALKKLLDAGFTTFTGLPSDQKELDEVFALTNKYNVKKVYSYGGEFPKNYMDASNLSSVEEKEKFYKSKSIELKNILNQKKWPSVVYMFSDEASGYSDRVVEDLKIAKDLKRHYPFMKIGGYSSFHSSNVVDLNLIFDEAFYYNLPTNYVDRVKKSKQNWGFYNGSPGNLDDPRFSFGPGLFMARAQGLSHYLEWHSSAIQNYPYYDFDGRESDVVLFHPKSNKTLLNGLRFELAIEGLQSYKKIVLLQELIKKNPSHKDAPNAKKWLEALSNKNDVFSDKNFMDNKKFNFKSFNQTLQIYLERLSK